MASTPEKSKSDFSIWTPYRWLIRKLSKGRTTYRKGAIVNIGEKKSRQTTDNNQEEIDTSQFPEFNVLRITATSNLNKHIERIASRLAQKETGILWEASEKRDKTLLEIQTAINNRLTENNEIILEARKIMGKYFEDINNINNIIDSKLYSYEATLNKIQSEIEKSRKEFADESTKRHEWLQTYNANLTEISQKISGIQSELVLLKNQQIFPDKLQLEVSPWPTTVRKSEIITEPMDQPKGIQPTIYESTNSTSIGSQ